MLSWRDSRAALSMCRSFTDLAKTRFYMFQYRNVSRRKIPIPPTDMGLTPVALPVTQPLNRHLKDAEETARNWLSEKLESNLSPSAAKHRIKPYTVTQRKPRRT